MPDLLRELFPLLARAAATLAIGISIACGPTRRPSILLITVDTLRADHLGCAGYQRAQTPAIDRLARAGLYFERAVAPVPLTLPSHASILTGLAPPAHGLHDNGPHALPSEITTLAEILSARGYRTGAFVAGQPLAHGCGLERGFDVYDFPLPLAAAGSLLLAERPAEEVTDAALAWLERDSSPFLLWVHYFDPHAPYTPPGDLAVTFADAPYDGEIAAVDRAVERLVRRSAAVAVSGLVTALCADHGEGLNDHDEPSHGFLVYESTVAVPLILAGHGIAPRPTPDARPARLIDVLPTLLDAVGLPIPSVQGVSLLRADPGPAYVESIYTHLHFGWAQLTALRSGNVKLIEGGDVLELYDVASDPAEKSNLAREREQEAALLGAELAAWRSVRPPAPGPFTAPASVGYLSTPRDDPLIELLPPERNRLLPAPFTMRRVIALFEAAVDALSRGDETEAAQRLEQARQLDPANPALLYWLARSAWSQARHTQELPLWQEALRLFDAVLERSPSHIDALNLAIQSLAAMGRFEEAAERGEKALGFANAATHEILGALYLERRSIVTGRPNPLRDPERGIQLLEQSLRLRETKGTLQKLERAYRETHQRDKAQAVRARLDQLDGQR
ncbi:MAG: sulfatase-like hydrolase/transferase [Planctomycetota bacterium]